MLYARTLVDLWESKDYLEIGLQWIRYPLIQKTWTAAAEQAIRAMSERNAFAGGHLECDAAGLATRISLALADEAFFAQWLFGTLPAEQWRLFKAALSSDSRGRLKSLIKGDDKDASEAEEQGGTRRFALTFGQHLEFLHTVPANQGRLPRKPRSSWVDLGISLIMEEAGRPWNRAGIGRSEAVERFRVFAWQAETLPRLMKALKSERDDDQARLASDPNGELVQGLWEVHWAANSKCLYTGAPTLGIYIKNLVYKPSELRIRPRRIPSRWIDTSVGGKPTAVRTTVIPMDGTMLSGLAKAYENTATDAKEAEQYRLLLTGAPVGSGRRNRHGEEQIRYPDGGLLRDLLRRHRNLLEKHGLHDVLEKLVEHEQLSETNRELTRWYFLEGRDRDEIAQLKKRGASALTMGLRRMWEQIIKIEGDEKVGLFQALKRIEEEGIQGPPDPDDRPTGPGGGTGGGGRRDGVANVAKFSGDDIDPRRLRAIHGASCLASGEWSREDVPDDVFESWRMVLGAEVFDALIYDDDMERNRADDWTSEEIDAVAAEAAVNLERLASRAADRPRPISRTTDTAEGRLIVQIREALPSSAIPKADLLMDPGLRWLPRAAGERDIDLSIPSVLPASYLLGSERFRLPDAPGPFRLTYLTEGHDPVAERSIRVEEGDVVVTPEYPADGVWRAFVAAPEGEDPLDHPGRRIVFLTNRVASPGPEPSDGAGLLLAHDLLAAWRKAVDEGLGRSELAAWLYVVLTHSEALLKEAYSVSLQHLRDPVEARILEDLEPSKAAGRLDSLRYVLLDMIRGRLG